MSAFTPFSGERIALVGLGRAGLPAARRLADWGAEVTCWDDRPEARAAAAAAGLAVADPTVGPFRWDALLLSPGIPHRLPAPHPAAVAARAAGRPILCDVEYLYRAVRAAGLAARFVGITGTNGKSTTTVLIHHILVTAGLPAMLGGNIGLPILGQDPLPAGGVYVLELSSYQIDLTMSLDCDVAVLLNITPDHLDRYDGFAG